MDSDLDAILKLLPAGAHKTIILALLLAPYATRIYYAFARGHGLRGAWRALWFGTNTPKDPSTTTTTTTSTKTP